MGRTGAVTPVAILEPVELSGTTVKRASLFNWDEVRRLDVRIGDLVAVEKAGEIIPQVIEVNVAARTGGEQEIAPPTRCPSCRSTLVRREGEVVLRCPNRACPEQRWKSVQFFCARSALNIEGIGEVLAQELVRTGLIEDVADIFDLTMEKLLPPEVAAKAAPSVPAEGEGDREEGGAPAAAGSGDEGRPLEAAPAESGTGAAGARAVKLNRMARKSAENLLAAIARGRAQATLSRLLIGLGISHVGVVAARAIAARFGSLQALCDASPETRREEMAAIDGVGPVIADALAAYLADPANARLLARLRARGVSPVEPAARPAAGGPLSGKRVCVTGKLSRPRSDIQKDIEAAGGRSSPPVGKNTDILVAGGDVGKTKLDSARKLGTQIVDEETLSRLLAGQDGDPSPTPPDP